MTHDQKRLLKPYTRLLVDTEKSLAELSGGDIDRLSRACAAASQSNCWVYTFRAAQMLLPMIRSIEHARKPAALTTGKGGET
jgi:hypothetical protein